MRPWSPRYGSPIDLNDFEDRHLLLCHVPPVPLAGHLQEPSGKGPEVFEGRFGFGELEQEIKSAGMEESI